MKAARGVWGALLFAIVLGACKEQIDTSARYVLKEETAYSYLCKHEQYSSYVDLLGKVPVSRLSTSNVGALLSARGHFTVFAPDNDAIQAYLDTLTQKGIIESPTWEGFGDSATLDSIRKVIVYNSVINSGDNLPAYDMAQFPINDGGEFPLNNMYDRKLIINYYDDPDSITINGALIDKRNNNIRVLNGYIHNVRSVVAPTNNTLGNLLNTLYTEKRPRYYVSSMLVRAIGMLDTLQAYRDETYEMAYQTGLVPEKIAHTSGIGYTEGWLPEHRYFGFTFFAETDDVWEKAIGKDRLDITVEDVVNWLQSNGYYPTAKVDDNYKSEDNILNQFVTYHFLPMRLASDRLVLHWNEKGYSSQKKAPSVVQYEYYTCMGKRRLVKFLESAESDGVCINRFPTIDNSRRGSYHETGCDADKAGIKVPVPETGGEFNVRNGIIYPIDQIMAYTEDVRNNLHKERIRFDIVSAMPEMMNNDLRLQYYSRPQRSGFPFTSQYPYFDDVYIGDESWFFYYNGYNETMKNYQGDELNVRGFLDVTFRLPPVPADGIYEIRFNVQSEGYNRGMVQFYWGENKDNLPPMGIPLDIRTSGLERRTTSGTFPSNVGWEKDTQDDDYNAEVDKKMRNNGFMKGAAIYCDGGQGMSVMAREDPVIVRRVIVRENMKADETYYLRFKSVLDDQSREFYMDFLEFCPKEVYDNPETPEDIW